MADSPIWMIWPGNAALSALVWFLIAMPFLYAARAPVHALLRSLGHLAGGPLRLASRALLAAATELRERNRAVLLAQGREDTGERIAREFERVAQLVKRDLAGYPALQRRLLDEITRVEEDYKKCGEIPPPPPEWVEAVAAVAKIKPNGNELVQRLLEEINVSIKQIHDKAIAEYRRAYQGRHPPPSMLQAERSAFASLRSQPTNSQGTSRFLAGRIQPVPRLRMVPACCQSAS
jgi:hypothetical protein